jgi:integrase
MARDSSRYTSAAAYAAEFGPEVEVLGRRARRRRTTVPNRVRWWTQIAREWSESIEGISEATRRTYREKSWGVYAVLRRLGFDPTPKTVTRVMVEAVLRDETLAPTTRQTYAFCLRGVIGFAGNRLADTSHRRLWKPPKWVATHRRWATLEENVAVLNHARDERALVAVALLGCGLREDEVIRLRVGDLEQTPRGWCARVRGKGAKLRMVPLTEQAVDALIPVVTGKGTSELVYGYRRARLWNDVRLACSAAGIRHLSPHDLRRGYARNYLAAAEPVLGFRRALMSLKDNLGHEDEAQSLYYAGSQLEDGATGVATLSKAYTARKTEGA